MARVDGYDERATGIKPLASGTGNDRFGVNREL